LRKTVNDPPLKLWAFQSGYEVRKTTRATVNEPGSQQFEIPLNDTQGIAVGVEMLIGKEQYAVTQVGPASVIVVRLPRVIPTGVEVNFNRIINET
jgi:hypothetical protein